MTIKTSFRSLRHANRYIKRKCGIHCIVIGVDKNTGDDCYLVIADKDNDLFTSGHYAAIPEMITIAGVTLTTSVYDCTSLQYAEPVAMQGQKPAANEHLHTLITASGGEYVGTVNARYGDYAITNHHVAPTVGAEAKYVRRRNWSTFGRVTHSTKIHASNLQNWWPFLQRIWPFRNTPFNNYLDLALIRITNNAYKRLIAPITAVMEPQPGMQVRLDTWQTAARGVVLAVRVDMPVWFGDQRIIMRDQTIIYWHTDPSKSGDSGGVIVFVDADGNVVAVCLHAWGDSNGNAGGQNMVTVLDVMRDMVG